MTTKTQVRHDCQHTLSLPGPAATLQALHLCPDCAHEELGNPFAGEYGFHIYLVDPAQEFAGMLQTLPDTGEEAWIERRDHALQLARHFLPQNGLATIEQCQGPERCPMTDHGELWVRHIARAAAAFENHGRGNIPIDDYDLASARQQALAKP